MTVPQVHSYTIKICRWVILISCLIWSPCTSAFGQALWLLFRSFEQMIWHYWHRARIPHNILALGRLERCCWRVLNVKIEITKKPAYSAGFIVLLGAWRWPTLTWGDPTLPSARLRFTSEFGMGSGGTTMLLSPSKFGLNKTRERTVCC